MTLSDVLAEKKSAILDRWVDAALAAYSKDGARFFKAQKDPFANPLGHSAREGLAASFELILTRQESGPFACLPDPVEQFLRLRAVQEMSPSQAVAFLYCLKPILLNLCGPQAVAQDPQGWLRLEDNIDQLALRAFDLYMENRERLFQIKLKDIESGNALLTRGRCPSSQLGDGGQESETLRFIQAS